MVGVRGMEQILEGAEMARVVAVYQREAAIWKAMREVVEISQESFYDRVGVFVRQEASRTEKRQNQSLPPYEEDDKEDVEIEDGIRAWRQVLMFFART